MLKASLDNDAYGAYIDLEKARIDFEGKGINSVTGERYNYLRFNKNENGKLELGLSGLDVKLTNKNDNPSLTGYIDATSRGLVSEFRRGVTYSVVCSTQSNTNTKLLQLENFSNYDSSFENSVTTESGEIDSQNSIQ
jgi:hypothetical protein